MKTVSNLRFSLKGIAFLSGCGILYGLVFSSLYPIIGIVQLLFGIIIVVLSGWFFGIGIGVVTGILISAIDSFFVSWFISAKLTEHIFGLFFEIGAGGVSGWIGYLHRGIKKQTRKLEEEKNSIEK